MTFPHYHEDIAHLHVNTLPNRAYFIPHGCRETALTGVRTASSRMTLLSGAWNFGYYESFLDLPEKSTQALFDYLMQCRSRVKGIC